MITSDKPLLTLTAADLMNQEVVTIPQDMTLRAAARLLAREQISGVPVVNAQGQCVGILSASDFLALWAAEGAAADEEVHRHMTADPVLVEPSTPITTLARMMIDAHIHRVVVVDGQRKPIGVVSSTDVLAAVTFSDHQRWTPGGT
jgi:CBS domain-containing protein